MSTGESKVVVLDLWASPFAMRVKLALSEKGIDFEPKQQDLANKSELLLQSNPVYKKVPVLIVHGDRTHALSESLVIVDYIEETWPNPPLLPSTPYDRYLARFWADFIDKKLAPAADKAWRNADPSKGGEIKKEFLEVLKQLEEVLGENDYFGGDRFGLVDLALIPFSSWFSTYEKFGGFKIESSKISAWIERCLGRKTVAGQIPSQEKVLQFAYELRKMVGIDK